MSSTEIAQSNVRNASCHRPCPCGPTHRLKHERFLSIVSLLRTPTAATARARATVRLVWFPLSVPVPATACAGASLIGLLTLSRTVATWKLI